MKKIILLANTDWYLYNFRLALARLLREGGDEVVFVSPGGPYASLLQEAGFRWLQWEVGRKSSAPLGELGAIVALIRLYRQERPCLAHHFTIKPVLYGSLAARFAGFPAVVNAITGRGYVFMADELRARRMQPAVKLLYKLAFSLSFQAVIFENPGDRQFFLDEGLVTSQRCHLIPGVGVDDRRYHPLPELPGEPVVVLPARMLWDKGVGVLVEAARLLKGKAPLRVALVGMPDAGNPSSIPESMLRGWVEQGLVEWWGWQADMPQVYAQSHIVTLPSLHEGVPTVLIEAAACARPLVASDIPGCREVVIQGETGLVVPVNDPQALAEALQMLAQQPALRQQLGAAGRALVMEKFTNEKINRRTLQVYQALVGASR
jgi:glycosyltransferase involved in cell wall biosynthesis